MYISCKNSMKYALLLNSASEYICGVTHFLFTSVGRSLRRTGPCRLMRCTSLTQVLNTSKWAGAVPLTRQSVNARVAPCVELHSAEPRHLSEGTSQSPAESSAGHPILHRPFIKSLPCLVLFFTPRWHSPVVTLIHKRLFDRNSKPLAGSC